MAAAQPPLSVDDLPAEEVAALVAIASLDGDRLCYFLDQLRPGITPEERMALPAEFLFHLASALRLVIWEYQGFFLHRDAGLPDGWQALHDAFLWLTHPDAPPRDLKGPVRRLALERFAWCGPEELGAEIALDETPEDALLDALADFLWARRPR